jgi:hypothetical protein
VRGHRDAGYAGADNGDIDLGYASHGVKLIERRAIATPEARCDNGPG